MTHYRTCNLCEAMCGLAIRTRHDEILNIRGDKDDPFSRGHICAKATALADIHQDPDRLRRPIERVGDEWRELSWDDALDKAAAGLQRVQRTHGNDSLGAYLGNPNVHNLGSMLFGRHLLRGLKTKNKYSATSVDQLPHHIVAHKLFGHQLQIPVPDIDRTDHFLVIGANPIASNGSIMTVPDFRGRLAELKQRGGRMIVIDPRRTETAEAATEHHFITPGTDVLLLLAMIHALFEEGLQAPGRLATFTPDWQRLQADVAGYPPERVAAYIGIDAGTIRQLVRDFANAQAPVCYGRIGASVQAFGTLSQYLIAVFNILTGRADEPGGMMFTTPAADLLSRTGPGHLGRKHSRVRGLPGFGGELPVPALAEEILTPGDGQIRGMLLVAGNPVLTTPNGKQLDTAFQQLDFMVSIDLYRNESNRHADIILPPTSPLEREHYDLIFHLLAVRNTAKYSPALFRPDKDARDDGQIFLELTQRLTHTATTSERLRAKLLRWLGPRMQLDLLLRSGPYGGGRNPFKGLTLRKLRKHPHGVDLGPLTSRLPDALHHSDKTIHLCRDFFLSDLSRVERHFLDSHAKSDDQRLLLIGRRHARSNNSWMHNYRRLVKGKPRCTVMMHPDDAEQRGIADGQPTRIVSRVGEIELPAEVTNAIMPGVVSIPHGWGHNRKGTHWRIAEQHAGASVNDLTDETQVDALSGNAVLNAVPVRAAPAPQGDP